MAQRRRRHLRRDVLVFLASTVFHVALFFIAVSEFTYYPPPIETPAPVQIEIVPQSEQPIPPPPIPNVIIHERLAPTPTPSPPPTPQPQPPTPQKPQPPTPARVTTQLSPAPTAPVQANRAPQPAPTPKPTLAPSLAPITPATPAPNPGPPRVVTAPTAPTVQSKAFAAPHIVLHRNRNEAGAPLAPGVSIPGAIEAPPQQASGAPGGPGGGAPGGPGGGAAGGGLPSGALPGFGSGLRGSVLGCANAAALHLSKAEQAKCNEAFGTGARESPVMDPIGATKRADIDQQAAGEAAARRYRDSTPAGSEVGPIAGQPRILHRPGEQ
jgi:outer membrane biosynthesis protein TonB